jgi:hypothetical protein
MNGASPLFLAIGLSAELYKGIETCVVACWGDDGDLYPCRESAQQDLRLVDIMNILRRSSETVSECREDNMG